jgi:hypothetical protein
MIIYRRPSELRCKSSLCCSIVIKKTSSNSKDLKNQKNKKRSNKRSKNLKHNSFHSTMTIFSLPKWVNLIIKRIIRFGADIVALGLLTNFVIVLGVQRNSAFTTINYGRRGRYSLTIRLSSQLNQFLVKKRS